MNMRYVGEVVEVTQDCEIGQMTERATVTHLDGPYMTLTFHADTTQGRGLVVHTGADYRYLRTVETAAATITITLEISGDIDEASQIVERFLDNGTLQDEINESGVCGVVSAVQS